MRVAAVLLFVLVAPMSVLTWVPPDARVAGLALALLLAVPVAIFAVSLVEPFRCPACRRPFFPSTAAVAVTCVVAGLIGSRAFPRELLVLSAGVILASCLAAQVNHADSFARFRPTVRPTGAPCPTAGPRRAP
jgi:hypothetical protein